MRVKPKKQDQIVSISSREPEVSQILGDDVFVKVFFDFDVQAALESGAVVCDYKVYKETITSTVRQKLSAVESRLAVNKAAQRKSDSISKLSRQIAVGKVDLTKMIPNDRVGMILSGKFVRKVKSLRIVGSTDASSTKLDAPTSTLSSSVQKSERNILSNSIDALNRGNKDVAAEINRAPFHAPIAAISGGVRTTGNLAGVSKKILQLRESLVENFGSPASVKVEEEETKNAEAFFTFKIKKRSLSTYKVEVDVKTQTEVSKPARILQTITFDVDLVEAFQEHIIPTEAPQLQIVDLGGAKAVRIKQRDRYATGVRLYRRIISDKDEQLPSSFSRVTEISLDRGQEAQFIDRPVGAGKCIYRAVPVNEIGVTSGEFSSAVTRASKVTDRKYDDDTLAVLAIENEGTIIVNAYNIPNDIVSLRLVRKNVTTRERSFSTPTTLVTNQILKFERETEQAQAVDRPTRSNSVYQYKFLMFDAYGNVRESQKSALIHFSGDNSSREGRTLIVVPPQNSRDAGEKVTFQVDAPTDQASLDKVIEILTQAGLESQYEEEIRQNRELFSKITALEMLRFDTFTGINESFGVVKSGIFEDSNRTRKSGNVSPLVPGRVYVYQFRLLIRSPGTIFRQTSTSSVDLETAKSFSVNLKKFNSPRTLKSGVLASTSRQIGAGTRTGVKFDAVFGSESEMIAGRTSLTGFLVVQAPGKETALSGIQAEESSRGNVVRWNVTQGLQKIDHVIVYAEFNGRRAPLRALHYSGENTMIYLDDRLKARSGEVQYFVRPVFTNLKQGNLIGPAGV